MINETHSDSQEDHENSTEDSKETPVAQRDERGRFIKGQSGNPKGKPKGTKHRMQELKLQHEAALREYMSDPERQGYVLDGLDNIFRIMRNGEDNHAVTAAKLVLDKLMPKASSSDSDGSGRGQGPIQIVIEAPSDRPMKTTGIAVEQPTEDS